MGGRKEKWEEGTGVGRGHRQEEADLGSVQG